MRLATADDLASVVAVFTEARAGMQYVPSRHTAAEDADYFSRRIGAGHVTVAECDGQVVAFSAVAAGWLDHLYVRPSAQRLGHGTVLLDRAKRDNPTGLQLWVFEDNHEASEFYERHGFRLEEQRSRDQADNEEGLADRRYRWD